MPQNSTCTYLYGDELELDGQGDHEIVYREYIIIPNTLDYYLTEKMLDYYLTF
jgi:hypothetical protein